MTSGGQDTITVIVNQAAGGGRCGKKASSVLNELQEGVNACLDIHHTGKPGDATLIARQAWLAGSRRFWCVGGDGTLFEVINGLFPHDSDDRPCVGVLPLGTGNSFLRDFNIHDTKTAISALSREKFRTVDAIRLEHDEGVIYFMNLCSIGFSARVGMATNRWFKPFGAAGYNMAVVLSLLGLNHPVYPLSIDNAPVDDRPCTLISFCNSRYTGGTMMMAPEADTGDGHMDIIRLNSMGRLSLLRAFPKIFDGSHINLEQVECERAEKVVFQDPQPMDVLLDGEVFHIIPRSIQVFAGALDVYT